MLFLFVSSLYKTLQAQHIFLILFLRLLLLQKHLLFINLNVFLQIFYSKSLFVSWLPKPKYLTYIKARNVKTTAIYALPNSQYLFKNLFVCTKSIFCGKKKTSLLRDSLLYNKSKYSRTRQLCVNIAILGLLINIILISTLHTSFYNLSINWHAVLYNFTFFLTILFIVKSLLNKKKGMFASNTIFAMNLRLFLIKQPFLTYLIVFLLVFTQGCFFFKINNFIFIPSLYTYVYNLFSILPQLQFLYHNLLIVLFFLTAVCSFYTKTTFTKTLLLSYKLPNALIFFKKNFMYLSTK